MADNKSSGGDTLHDTGIGWALLLFVFFVLLYIFWHYYAVDIRNMVRWIRYGEMKLIALFVDDDYTVPYRGAQTRWEDGYKLTPRWRPEALTNQHLIYFSALAMTPLKMLFSVLFVLGGFWCILFGPSTQYRRKMNLEGLIHQQAKNFPVIAPFLDFNPSKMPQRAPGSPVPAELPMFSEALGPEEWLAYCSISFSDGKIDEAAATDAFMLQLGGRWKGSNALKPYQQVLLAAFCLKASRKRADADAMLGRLAHCFHKQKLKLGRDRRILRDARRILRDNALAGKTLAQANRHAYVTTALLRALQFARAEGGVLAPAQFVWLRAHDRALWYPLNNLGRQSFHMEALGAMSHYKAERMTQRPIPVPKIDGAVQTLKEYMSSSRARPIPPVDLGRGRRKTSKAS